MLLIFFANLLASMCHAMPFSARALKKPIFFDADIVVKKNRIGLSWSILLSPTSTHHYSFRKQFFYCFSMLSEFKKVFERKVWRVQVAHLLNAASALSSQSRCFQLWTNVDKDFFVIFDIVVKNKSRSVLLSTTILVITVVKICCETIFSSETSTKCKTSIFKICPPVIITSPSGIWRHSRPKRAQGFLQSPE